MLLDPLKCHILILMARSLRLQKKKNFCSYDHMYKQVFTYDSKNVTEFSD